MSDARVSESSRLQDGRTLSYAEYGVPDGRPVVWCHGLPGSRLDLSIGAGPELVSELGLRVLAPDRPGFGRSDPHPGRSYASYADDVRQLADACGIGRFAVLGYSGGSGGSGYALSCAAALSHRVDSVGIVSGAGPRSTPRFSTGLWRTDKVMLLLSRWLPVAARAALRSAARDVRSKPETFLRTLRKDLSASPHDVELLKEPDAAQRILTAFTEATALGPDGCVLDWALWRRPWQVDLATAADRPIHLWHGDQDPVIPAHHSRHLQALLPGAQLHAWPGEGHFHDDARWREVFAALKDPPNPS